MNAALPTAEVSLVSESWTAFAAWAADELGLRLTFDGNVYQAEPQPYEAAPGSGPKAARKSWLLRRIKQAEEAQPAEEPIEADSPSGLVLVLIHRLRERHQLAQLRPIDQPSAVHEITSRLFNAYQLEGGSVHIAGCSLEDVPFVRISTLDPTTTDETRLIHAFYNEQGERLEQEAVVSLGLDHAGPFGDAAPRPADDLLAELIASARHALFGSDEFFTQEDSVAALVWVKRVSGRLSFEFGDETVTTEFDDWAKTLTPPPVICPLTRRETYNLTTVEGGAIVAAEEIATSDVTGLSRVSSELLSCSVTGKQGEAEWFGASEVTGKPVLLEHATLCPRCGLQIAESEITTDGCVACDRATKLLASDPRIHAILEHHPQLSGARWRLAETPTALVLLADGWFTHRAATIDKTTLKLLRYAQRSRFSHVWREISS